MSNKQSQIVIAQRMHLTESLNLSRDEAIAHELCKNGRALSDAELRDEIAKVKELVGSSAAYLEELRNRTHADAVREIEETDRATKERNTVSLLSALKDKRNAHIGYMELPDGLPAYADIAARSALVSEMTDDELNELYLACLMMWAQYNVTETFARCAAVQEVPYADCGADKTARYELAVAAALNLKASGKLDREFASLDEQTLSDVVCGSIDNSDICSDVAKPHMTISGVVGTAFYLSLAVISGIYGGILIGTPGCRFMGVLSFGTAAFCLAYAAEIAENDLAPAGYAETKVGVYCCDKARALSQNLHDLLQKIVPAAQARAQQTAEAAAGTDVGDIVSAEAEAPACC